MKWTHLPASGGLYAQHPKLLDDWQYIFQRRAEYESRKQKQEEQQNKRPQRGRRGRR